MPDSDASLIRLAASGNPEAFPALLYRHGQAIHAYLARRSDRDTADDLLSEVFLRAYTGLRQYDQRWANARPWLYGIARNVLREHWRRTGLTDAGQQALAHLLAAEDPWPDVDSRLDASARLVSIRAALARLARTDREVLLLVTWEGLTPAEASVALGIPAGTARSRLHRARTMMRQLLDADDAGDGREAAHFQEA